MIEDVTVHIFRRRRNDPILSRARSSAAMLGDPPTSWRWKVRASKDHLVSIGITRPALNQIVCALRLFYGVTLGEAVIPERILLGETCVLLVPNSMKIQPMQQIAGNILRSRPMLCGLLAVIDKTSKWQLWHGQVDRVN